MCDSIAAVYEANKSRKSQRRDTYLVRLYTTLLKNLLNNLVLVGSAELVLKLAIARGVQDTLLSVPIQNAVSKSCLMTCYVRVRLSPSQQTNGGQTHSGTMIFHPATTSLRGILESFFQFCTASSLSTNMVNWSPLLPL